MIIKNTIIRPNGVVEVVEIEVAENYFTPPENETTPTSEERLSAVEAAMLEMLLGGAK